MTNFLKYLSALCLLSLPSFAYSQIADGTYIYRQSLGEIKISTNKLGQQVFELQNIGDNGHLCEASGYITDHTGYMMDYPQDTQNNNSCQLSFYKHGHILDIDINDWQACSQYCGARASLAGSYRKVPNTCSQDNIAKQRSQFKSLYDQALFTAAANTLTSLLTKCDFYLDFNEKDAIRNDLALTYYHQDSPNLCLEVLSQTIAWTAHHVEEQDNVLPPFEQEIYQNTQKAILFNIGLCEKASTHNQK